MYKISVRIKTPKINIICFLLLTYSNEKTHEVNEKLKIFVDDEICFLFEEYSFFFTLTI